MLSREQLEKLSLEDLQAIARDFGITPIGGNFKTKEVWVNALARFPYKAIDQMRDGIGLHHPGKEAYDKLTEVLDLIGEPTDSQRALLKMCDADRWLENETWRYYQEKMRDIFRAQILIKNAIKLLVG
jgi:hypothetical protein